MWLRQHGLKPSIPNPEPWMSEQDRLPLGVGKWLDAIDQVATAIENGA
jgi:hypothetical protein